MSQIDKLLEIPGNILRGDKLIIKAFENDDNIIYMDDDKIKTLVINAQVEDIYIAIKKDKNSLKVIEFLNDIEDVTIREVNPDTKIIVAENVSIKLNVLIGSNGTNIKAPIEL